MNIGIDAHVLSGKFQGSRTYILNLYSEIEKKNSQHRFLFFVNKETGNPVGDFNNYVQYANSSKLARLTLGSYNLLKKNNVDVFHSQYISPLLLPCPSLLTVHDILFETHPKYFTKSEVIRNRILVRQSVKRAKQIHSVSEYTKLKLVELYGVKENKIKVVPNGVNLTNFNSINKERSIDLVKSRYQIEDYILTVGRIEPRKNHVGLLYAYKKASERLMNLGPLVIVGQPDFGYNKFYETINELNLNNKVKILDSVEDSMLPHLYKSAKLFVYPSFAEGFGIPPLEAMASGVPVISSNTTAIPEVVGDAGILIDPNENDQIAVAIELVMSDDKLQISMSKMGVLRASHFTWRAAAEKYLEAINQI